MGKTPAGLGGRRAAPGGPRGEGEVVCWKLGGLAAA